MDLRQAIFIAADPSTFSAATLRCAIATLREVAHKARQLALSGREMDLLADAACRYLERKQRSLSAQQED